MSRGINATALGLALAALSFTAAQAADYPPRKAGLWEIKTTDAAAKGQAVSMQQCIDAATDKAMRDMGKGAGQQQECSKQDMRNEGNTIVIESVCKMGPTTATSRAVMTGDFSSNYRMESKSTFNPPMAGQKESNAVIEAKWVGPCAAGQKPGDMIMPGGMKMNVLDMAGSMRGAMPKK